MRKRTHRKVRILLGGLARLVGFLRTMLGFKVASLPPQVDWIELGFSFEVNYFADDPIRLKPSRLPISTTPDPEFPEESNEDRP